MKVVLVGGNGFIGKNLYGYLKKKQYHVMVYDQNIEIESDDQIKGDLENVQALSKLIDNGDVVIHLAGNIVPSSSGKNVIQEITNSIIPSITLFEICRKKQVKKIIFASSGGAVYGTNNEELINEKCLPEPISSYGINKLTIEHYLRYLGKRNSINIVNLRIANPYGFAQKPFKGQGIIATYIASVFMGKEIEIWGDGSSVKDYIYIDDVSEAFEKAINWDGMYGLFNIGTGKGNSIKEVIQIIKKILPEEKIKIKFLDELSIDVKRNVLNCQKAKKELNWEAKTELEQGISKMVLLWDSEQQAFVHEL